MHDPEKIAGIFRKDWPAFHSQVQAVLAQTTATITMPMGSHVSNLVFKECMHLKTRFIYEKYVFHGRQAIYQRIFLHARAFMKIENLECQKNNFNADCMRNKQCSIALVLFLS